MATKTVVIKPGEKIILPKDAVIEALVLDGSISVESTCDDLPDPVSYKCGYFFIIIDADNSGDHSMDMDTKYNSLIVGDTTYTIDEYVAYGDGNNPVPMPVSVLNTHITDQAIFKFMALTANEVTSRTHLHIYFKVPEPLFDSVRLVVDNRNTGSLQEYKGLESECDDYPDPA